jgi:hypothetical protein
MGHSTSPTYLSKEALVLELKDFICRCPTRILNFNTAITSAISDGPDDMGSRGNYRPRYFSPVLRKVPAVGTKVSSRGDALPRKILVFYWVFDQPAIIGLQAPITPETSNTDLSWLSYWLVSFARQLGQFLHTPKSAGLIYTFYVNIRYSLEAERWEQPATGWLSFNHWFRRCWKDIQHARPIDSPHDDKVITMPADSVYDGNWPIVKG